MRDKPIDKLKQKVEQIFDKLSIKWVTNELEILSVTATFNDGTLWEYIPLQKECFAISRKLEYEENVPEDSEACPFCGEKVRWVDPNAGGGQRVAVTMLLYPHCDSCDCEFRFAGRSSSRIKKTFNTRTEKKV